jgi:hypothetical protein
MTEYTNAMPVNRDLLMHSTETCDAGSDAGRNYTSNAFYRDLVMHSTETCDAGSDAGRTETSNAFYRPHNAFYFLPAMQVQL